MTAELTERERDNLRLFLKRCQFDDFLKKTDGYPDNGKAGTEQAYFMASAAQKMEAALELQSD